MRGDGRRLGPEPRLDSERTAAELGAAALPLDVTDQDAFDAAIDQIVADHGSLDILVNNAGVYREYGGGIADITPEMWRVLWSVNVDACSTGARRPRA